MNKVLMGLISYLILMTTSILVMVFGWGLEAKSWGWIIGGGLAGTFIGALFQLWED